MTKDLKDGLEYNILGCEVRVVAEGEELAKAKESISLLREEIEAFKAKSPNSKDIDLAVLVALKFASEKISIESEYKANIFELRDGVGDALKYVESVSPGRMNN